jgi:ABC-type nitrate/sulfonate/bicarbonate transport system permease component
MSVSLHPPTADRATTDAPETGAERPSPPPVPATAAATGPAMAGRSGRPKLPLHRRVLIRLGRMAPAIVVALLLLVTWQFYVAHWHIDQTVLPGPLRVLEQGWKDRHNLWANTLPTMKETLIGFALSITVGWLLAVICDFSALCRRAIEPLLVVSQTIPVIAIAPLFVIWFGFATTPKVLIVALVTFFPITVSLLQGFGTTAAEATNLLRSMGANRVQRFVRLRVPTALPYFFSGLRIAITYAVIGAIFGEYVGAEKGLGIYMQISQNSRRTDLVLATVTVAAAVSLALYGVVTTIERLSIPWSRTGVEKGKQR